MESQGRVIAGGVWAQSCALGVMGVAREVEDGWVLSGTCFMLEIEGEDIWVDGGVISTEDEIVDPEARVVRLASDSVGVGGKSLGWFLVPTIFECFSELQILCSRGGC